jgi:hypothetical protein
MPATVTKPTAFEQGDHLYIVAPVVPSTPTESEIEEYAFGKDLVAQMKGTAPNSHIAWFGGHYVEADRPNLNGAMWLAEDLAVASLSPTMMPVTVMHAPRYECSECRMPFLKLPNGAEKAGWCDHLKSSRPSAGYSASHDAGNRNASRILRGVTFTGTGLIFGTRGKVGADPSANLEAFQEEVAEFHEKAHRDRTRKPKPRSKSKMEIEDARYAELVAAEAKAKALETKVSELEATAAKVPDLEKKVTETEATAAAETQRFRERRRRAPHPERLRAPQRRRQAVHPGEEVLTTVSISRGTEPR